MDLHCWNYRTIFRPRSLAQALSLLVAAETRPSSCFNATSAWHLFPRCSPTTPNRHREGCFDSRLPGCGTPVTQHWAKCRPRVESNLCGRLGTAQTATYCPKSTIKYHIHNQRGYGWVTLARKPSVEVAAENGERASSQRPGGASGAGGLIPGLSSALHGP